MRALRSSPEPDREKAPIAVSSRSLLRVAIVGGGASGALMALALCRAGRDIRVTIIEPSTRLGAGLAYATDRPEHRLNVLPQRLSAYADRPLDFAAWLVERGEIGAIDAAAFVRRSLMGDYLRDRLGAIGHRLAVVQGAATAFLVDRDTPRVCLSSGDQIDADVVILATGHSWSPSPGQTEPTPDSPVTILGTGLSMVDRWLTLRDSGHIGPITAVSRHGLVPLAHGRSAMPAPGVAVPLGRPVSQTMRWLRDSATRVEDWRVAIDAIRPHTQSVWRSWSKVERARFLRHARRHWDVHRHRLAPDIHDRLTVELKSGALRIVRSREVPAGGRVFDCRGHFPDWAAIANPLLTSLLAAGVVRPDPLGLGLDVTPACRLIGRTGTARADLFAIGPLTRGTFWEIEAIPDIRAQCEALSREICDTADARRSLC